METMEIPQINSHDHTGNGILISFIFSILGLVVAETSQIWHKHLPSLLMDCLQAGAWATTICLGLATFYFKFIKKKKQP